MNDFHTIIQVLVSLGFFVGMVIVLYSNIKKRNNESVLQFEKIEDKVEQEIETLGYAIEQRLDDIESKLDEVANLVSNTNMIENERELQLIDCSISEK